MTEEAPTLHCSFCNKKQRDVKKLIAGPSVYICNECVDVCNGILAEDDIPAGRGARAAARTVRRAEELLQMAVDLAHSQNYFGAAREIRSAALEVLRGIALAEKESATQWSQSELILHALESDPEIARLLQIEDHAHIVLRVSIEGAGFTSEDVQRAATVIKSLMDLLQRKLEAL